VLLTPPSRRSDKALRPPLTPRQRCCAGEAQDPLGWRKHHDGTTGYFFIAAMAGVAASAIVGFVLTSLLVARVDKRDRPARGTYLMTNFRSECEKAENRLVGVDQIIQRIARRLNGVRSDGRRL
jgi:hypothetical protein